MTNEQILKELECPKTPLCKVWTLTEILRERLNAAIEFYHHTEECGKNGFPAQAKEREQFARIMGLK